MKIKTKIDGKNKGKPCKEPSRPIGGASPNHARALPTPPQHPGHHFKDGTGKEGNCIAKT